MQPVTGAEKLAIAGCQAREKENPVPSAVKRATGVKHGKISNRCQKRENE